MRMKPKVQKLLLKHSQMKKRHHQQLKKVHFVVSYFSLNSNLVSCDFPCEVCGLMKDMFIDQARRVHQPHGAHLLFLTLCNISAADAVGSEEVRGAAEESTAAVVSDTTEQASEMSSKQGKCTKTLLLKNKMVFFG